MVRFECRRVWTTRAIRNAKSTHDEGPLRNLHAIHSGQVSAYHSWGDVGQTVLRVITSFCRTSYRCFFCLQGSAITHYRVAWDVRADFMSSEDSEDMAIVGSYDVRAIRNNGSNLRCQVSDIQHLYAYRSHQPNGLSLLCRKERAVGRSSDAASKVFTINT